MAIPDTLAGLVPCAETRKSLGADTSTSRTTEAIFLELGLGPLLDRIPGACFNGSAKLGGSAPTASAVASTWRALLQQAGLVILDESLASLDPETQKQALECAMKRAPTLVVIAHP